MCLLKHILGIRLTLILFFYSFALKILVQRYKVVLSLHHATVKSDNWVSLSLKNICIYDIKDCYSKESHDLRFSDLLMISITSGLVDSTTLSYLCILHL